MLYKAACRTCGRPNGCTDVEWVEVPCNSRMPAAQWQRYQACACELDKRICNRRSGDMRLWDSAASEGLQTLLRLLNFSDQQLGYMPPAMPSQLELQRSRLPVRPVLS